MAFSLFKKATHDTATNPHGKAPEKSKPASSSADIAANNKKALDMVRALEYAGVEREKTNPTYAESTPHGKAYDTKACNPSALSPPGTTRLSPADMAAIKRWAGNYNSWSTLFQRLDKAMEYMGAEGYMGEDVKKAVMAESTAKAEGNK